MKHVCTELFLGARHVATSMMLAAEELSFQGSSSFTHPEPPSSLSLRLHLSPYSTFLTSFTSCLSSSVSLFVSTLFYTFKRIHRPLYIDSQHRYQQTATEMMKRGERRAL